MFPQPLKSALLRGPATWQTNTQEDPAIGEGARGEELPWPNLVDFTPMHACLPSSLPSLLPSLPSFLLPFLPWQLLRAGTTACTHL